MSDIVQRLGFDASSAISQIKSLQTALNGLNGSLNATAGGVKNFNKASATTSTGWRKTQTQIKNANAEIGKFANTQKTAANAKTISPISGKASTNVKQLNNQVDKLDRKTLGLTISWETLARVITTRLAIGGFNRIIQALREGTEAAIEFGIRLAEIGTIAGEGIDLSEIRKELVEVSRLTGKDLTDVAEGFYQTLSNQVGDAAESLHVFNQAAKLSVVTNSSLGDTVNLLTAAINGWQLSAADAGNVSAKLFKTVELGRLRVGDLANVLGAIGPISSKMGVSLDETLGSLANMTIQGTRANKSITQLRAVMTQMLKPTVELEKIMKQDWCVQNAEQAIKKFGSMTALLQELDKVSGGASNKMAEFFSNVRALSGIFSQLSGGDKVTQTIKEIEEASEGLLDTMLKMVLDTPAKKAQVAFNNLKVSLEEAGNALIPLATTGAKALSSMATHAWEIGTALSGLALAVTINKLWGMVAAFNAVSIAAARAWIAVAGGIGIAFAVGFALGELIVFLSNAEERTRAYALTLNDAAEAEAKFANELRVNYTEQIAEGWREADISATGYYSTLQINHAKALEGLKREIETSQELAEITFDDLISAQQKLIQGLEHADEKAMASSTRALRSQMNERVKLEERQFEWRIENLSKYSKAEAKSARASKLISAGVRRALRPGATSQQIKNGIRTIELGQKYAEQASRTASSVENLSKKSRALTKARRVEIKASKALQKVHGVTARRELEAVRGTKPELQNQRKRLIAIKQLAERIIELNKPTTESGSSKTTKQLKEDIKELTRTWEKLNALFGQDDRSKNIDLSKRLKLGNIGARINKLSRELPAVQLTLKADYRKFVTELIRLGKENPLEVDVLLRASGFEIDPLADPIERANAISKLTKKTIELQKEFNKARGLMTLLSTQVEAIEPLRKEGLIDPTRFVGKGAKEVVDTYKQIRKDLEATKDFEFLPGSKDAAKVADLGSRISKLIKRLKELRTGGDPKDAISRGQVRGSLGWRTIQDLQIAETQIIKMLPNLKSIGKISEEAYTSSIKARQELQGVLDAVPKKLEIQVGAKDFVTGMINADLSMKSIATIASTMEPSALVTGLTHAEVIVNRIAATIKSTKIDTNTTQNGTVVPLPKVQERARGGLIKYYNNGGFTPRGTDTVPAMLTPGEFVVNAKSTRKFYSQLVSMNSGSQPIYKAVGGPVTNNTIGDINVTVDGGQTNVQSAREIATALRREMRRNTLSLN